MELFCDVVIYFVLFSFCGWVCESIFCSCLERKPVNRGFLSGPFCPVYGFGGLIIIYFLSPYRHNIALLFLMGMILTSLLEYITSWVLEKLFQTQWWDYSHLQFNINGRVCLQFSLLFGALSVLAEWLLYPPFSALLTTIPLWFKPWLAFGMLLIMGGDCAVTVVSILQLNGKLAEMHKAMQELLQKLEAVQSDSMPLAQRIEQYRAEQKEKNAAVRQSIEQSLAKFERLKSKPRLQHRRIIRAFPNMKSHRYQEQFAKLKESLGEIKKKAKKNAETP